MLNAFVSHDTFSIKLIYLSIGIKIFYTQKINKLVILKHNAIHCEIQNTGETAVKKSI